MSDEAIALRCVRRVGIIAPTSASHRTLLPLRQTGKKKEEMRRQRKVEIKKYEWLNGLSFFFLCDFSFFFLSFNFYLYVGFHAWGYVWGVLGQVNRLENKDSGPDFGLEKSD